MTELILELPRDLDSAAAARRVIDAAATLPDDQRGDVRLLVSELVTNSLLHAELGAADKITLVLDVNASRTRVEVSDSGGSFAFDGEATDPDTVEGWGLYLVATLSDRWAIAPAADRGATVWFELDRANEAYEPGPESA